MLNTKVKSIKMIAVVTIFITIVCLALWVFSASADNSAYADGNSSQYFTGQGNVGNAAFRYMLFGGLMPAVKRNGVFVNLISMCEMSESELRSGNFNCPYLNDARIFAKSYYL